MGKQVWITTSELLVPCLPGSGSIHNLKERFHLSLRSSSGCWWRRASGLPSLLWQLPGSHPWHQQTLPTHSSTQGPWKARNTKDRVVTADPVGGGKSAAGSRLAEASVLPLVLVPARLQDFVPSGEQRVLGLPSHQGLRGSFHRASS